MTESRRRKANTPARRPKGKARRGTFAQLEVEVLKDIGQRIRAAREAVELTQEAAAARASIDYKRWQELEGGRVNPTARTLLRVSEALETSIWSLMRPPRGKRTD